MSTADPRLDGLSPKGTNHHRVAELTPIRMSLAYTTAGDLGPHTAGRGVVLTASKLTPFLPYVALRDRQLRSFALQANSDEGASKKFSEEEIVEENSEEEIQDNMTDNANNQRRTLADYTNPTTASCGSSIVWPTIDANNFELKPALVQLVQQN
ncbi:hypothetical protein PIB30_080127 [Stylosanthes scabra]|uniref:Uncharacterized protein n=1 Tax=Stylosanthes scabra TaxID=79078 RepID=A0ABU6UQ79_9FABA|nr:hypothetical protein [Stylosanthes scabra]